MRKMPPKKAAKSTKSAKAGKSVFRGLTVEERAKSHGLSVADYKKRAKINIEKREAMNKEFKKLATGVASQAERSKSMKKAWTHAAAVIRDKYPAAELKRIGVKA
jgi:hypothetical protein